MEALFELAIIWACVYLSEIIAHKTKLTPVLYFLAFGALCANLGILPFEPSEAIRAFAEVGIVLIMFALGFEENSSNFVKSIKRSWGIALFGAIAPFTTAYYLTYWFWGEQSTALMCALAMTATAVSLTMVSLKSEGLHKTSAATGIMTSAVLDDIASLALVAILVPIAAGTATLDPVVILQIIGKAIGFFVIIVLLGLIVFPKQTNGRFGNIPIIRSFGLEQVLSFDKGRHATLVLLLLAVTVGILAHEFGFHPAVGAYMAGLVIKEEYFHYHQHPAVDYHQKAGEIIDNVAFSWIGPIFFVALGTQLKLDWDLVTTIVPLSAILIFSLIAAQVLSAFLAARYTGGFRWSDSLLIGFGMLGRAELAFVVMDIAYVQYAILSTEAFYTLMFTAFWLNVSVPVTISLWKKWFKNSDMEVANVIKD